MAERLNRWSKDIIGAAIFEAVKYALLGAIAFAAAKMGSGFLTAKVSSLAAYRFWILVGIFAVVGIAGILFYQRLRNGGVRDCDFRLLQKRIEIELKADGTSIYRRRYKLRALKNNLRCYSDRYHWTGGTVGSMVVSNDEHTVHLTDRRAMWQYYEVRFQRPYQKGEIVNIEMVWNLLDPNHTAVPFISATIYEPTDSLCFSLLFDRSFGVKEIVCEHTPHIGEKKVFEAHSQTVDNHGLASWNIDHPKFLHYYEVKWTAHRQNQNLYEHPTPHPATPGRV